MSAPAEALLARVRELEEEVERLKAQLREKSAGGAEERTGASPDPVLPDVKSQENGGSRKKGKKERAFDFSAHPRRHVAVRLAYLGWNYQGFAVQENTDNTVEARLFEALLKTRLIQDRQSSNYHRCGRTDKGVSAFSQVISLDLRSCQYSGLGVMVPDGVEPKGSPPAAELPYVKILNRVLPTDIRVLCWAPVPAGFSARFDCRHRTYRYYFPRGDLDVELMAAAAKRYEGTHDFRNLCKMDVGNGVLQFQRTILSATVQPAQPCHASSNTEPQPLYMFEVKGLAFLYHQVRCMMAVLILIGQKLESPEIIDKLVDVENNPRKPQYSMAVDYPLVLYECHFEDLSWNKETEEESHVLSSLQQHWTQTAVKAQVLHGMIQGLQNSVTDKSSSPVDCWLMEGSRQRNYRPLLERPLCESLESRIQHFVKRGRLERDESGEETTVFRGKRSKHLHHVPSTEQQQEEDLSMEPALETLDGSP
ncbi:tRNA pseudouridine(38/39) synthase [Hoplias malabaricus]|uniref:tRNA pseudouridine(38/39) synthase n=1 Tax=Hoplias malabaricus TaxID=27720 RepID=UPI003462DDC3